MNNGRPTQALFMLAYDDRGELWLDFETIFHARDFARNALALWRKKGYEVALSGWGEHPPTGDYRVMFLGEPGVYADELLIAISDPKPPCSNRGVTKYE